MRKVIFVFLLTIFLSGCTKSPKEEIYIQARIYNTGVRDSYIIGEKSPINWYRTKVLRKDRDMWLIEIEKSKVWFDITDSTVMWKKAN